jgi:hypothetical protein
MEKPQQLKDLTVVEIKALLWDRSCLLEKARMDIGLLKAEMDRRLGEETKLDPEMEKAKALIRDTYKGPQGPAQSEG